MIRKPIPDDCRLTYIIEAETWYRASTPRECGINVVCASDGGGCLWEFQVFERDLGGPCLMLEMFSDAFDAFSMIPEFFEAIQNGPASSLTAVRVILDGIGAVDTTERVDPAQVGLARRQARRTGNQNAYQPGIDSSEDQ